jgi:hypothetical protein
VRDQVGSPAARRRNSVSTPPFAGSLIVAMSILYGVCSKESEEYEQSIIDDLGKLGIVGTWLYILSPFLSW